MGREAEQTSGDPYGQYQDIGAGDNGGRYQHIGAAALPLSDYRARAPVPGRFGRGAARWPIQVCSRAIVEGL